MEKPESWRKRKTRKWSRTFSFLCLAIAVICGMINYLCMTGATELVLVCRGRLCLCMAGGYGGILSRRRNILKNEMWQLLIVISDCHLVGSFLPDGEAGLWTSFFLSGVLGSAVLCSGDRKNKPAGTGRISVSILSRPESGRT